MLAETCNRWVCNRRDYVSVLTADIEVTQAVIRDGPDEADKAVVEGLVPGWDVARGYALIMKTLFSFVQP